MLRRRRRSLDPYLLGLILRYTGVGQFGRSRFSDSRSHRPSRAA